MTIMEVNISKKEWHGLSLIFVVPFLISDHFASIHLQQGHKF